VSRSLKALVLEAPLGVFVHFESAVDGLRLDPQACSEWRGIRRSFETGVLLYRCIGWALHPALS
jgi:hypothetical protein